MVQGGAGRSGPDPSAQRPSGPRRVVVTRAEEQAEPLAGRLRALGAEVVLCPLIRIESLSDEPLDLSGWDWVVVTSPNGARELARRLVAPPRRLAAIGPGTADALRAAGHEPDLVPRVHTQEGLRHELPPAPGRVLLAAAEGARRDVLDAEFLALYRTVELAPDAPPEGDIVVLASPSAARALAATGARIPAVAIGPLTAAAAREHGILVAAEAGSSDLDGLVAAVGRALASV
ncbi:MAG TPA: uroporphyrinogen-III synthase [Gaiellaceae bacterium]|nr:uroporphyrinogen-III synthase [Gaiellaceae bacterium]